MIWGAEPTNESCDVVGKVAGTGGVFYAVITEFIASAVSGNTCCDHGDDPWGNTSDQELITDVNDVEGACPGTCDGDLNNGGVINVLGLLIWLEYQTEGNPAGDLTGGGAVNGGDLSALIANFGALC